MNSWWTVGMVAASGAMMSFQGPINAELRKHVGLFESSLVSFSVGTLALIAVVLWKGDGHLGAIRNVSWWHLLGGLIGAVFVTTTLIAAPQIGVTKVIMAALAGQMTAALLIDRFGWVGIASRPVEPSRIAGVLLLVVAVFLINWRKA